MSIFKRGDVYGTTSCLQGGTFRSPRRRTQRRWRRPPNRSVAGNSKRDLIHLRMIGRNAFGRSPTLRRTTLKNTNFATGRRNSRSMPAVTSPD